MKTLTARESEILQYIADGHDAVSIANILQRSVSTVMVHRTNILNKLKAKNSCEAVSIGFRNNLIK